VLIVSEDTSQFASTFGMTPGLSVATPARLNAPGTVMRARLVDGASPIAYGLRRERVHLLGPGTGDGREQHARRTGRRARRRCRAKPADGTRTADDLDHPQGRPVVTPAEEPKVEAWQAAPVTASSCATR